MCVYVCSRAHVCVPVLLTFTLLGLGTFNPFSGDPLPANPKKQLILKVISGQQLPKPPDSMFGDRGEVSCTRLSFNYVIILLRVSTHLSGFRGIYVSVCWGGTDV